MIQVTILVYATLVNNDYNLQTATTNSLLLTKEDIST